MRYDEYREHVRAHFQKALTHSKSDSLWSLEFAGAARIPNWDGTLAREVVEHLAAFAEARIAPIDAPGDLQGCRLVDGRVHLTGFPTISSKPMMKSSIIAAMLGTI